MLAYYLTVIEACSLIAADPTERPDIRQAARETAEEYQERADRVRGGK